MSSVIDARRRGSAREGQQDHATPSTQPNDSLFEEKPARGKPKRSKPGMTLAQLQALELQHEAETKRAFEACKQLEPEMKRGDSEAEAAWFAEAQKLIESFRQVKPLFPSTRVSLSYRDLFVFYFKLYLFFLIMVD
jgi:general transcription factor 3C polypeptide 3 (transcription factor C subunit 4)